MNVIKNHFYYMYVNIYYYCLLNICESHVLVPIFDTSSQFCIYLWPKLWKIREWKKKITFSIEIAFLTKCQNYCRLSNKIFLHTHTHVKYQWLCVLQWFDMKRYVCEWIKCEEFVCVCLSSVLNEWNDDEKRL